MTRRIVNTVCVLSALATTAGSAAAAHACSVAPISLHEKYERKAKVFVGTVQAGAKQEGIFELSVDEPFKGISDKEKASGVVRVKFDVKTMCGFQPKRGERFLIYMNEGDAVGVHSGSMSIWRESEQAEAHLNPIIDQLVSLRKMLSGRGAAIVPVPDEETAVHLTVKALIPVYGKSVVSQSKPFTAKFDAGAAKHAERVWRVEGSNPCKKMKKGTACPGVLVVELNKWTGDVIRVSAGKN